MLRLDHLVFAAESLEAGRAWMEDRLGVCAQGGGAHPGRGTHNAVWRLGEAYLEVLAPDPDAPAPEGPRLFGVDAPALRPLLAAGPRLIAWVAAADDLDAALAAAPFPIGAPTAMTRGRLRWRLTVGAGGRPPLGGLGPALIEWPKGAHPVAMMSDTGLRLARFSARAPDPEALRAGLAAIGADALVEVEQAPGPPRLRCEITTRDGRRARFG
jgi:hypothetical protein